MERSQNDLRPGWVIARDEGRKLTWQQQLAERTNGVVRLPNLMTVTGIGLTILSARYASQNRPIAALATGVVAFSMDAEGSVAEPLGLIDPVGGAKIDQVADITKAAIVAGTLLKHEIMPPSAALLTYGPKAIGAGAGVAAKVAGQDLASSKLGKTAEVCRDAVPVAFLAAAIGEKLDNEQLTKISRTAAWVAVGAAATIGAMAAMGYVREAIAARKSADLSAHPAEILDYAEN